MIRREIGENEIAKVKLDLAKYSNVLTRDDSDFEDFLKSFGIEKHIDLSYVNLVLFKRIDSINYRLFIIMTNEVVVDQFEVVNADAFDKTWHTVTDLGKAFLTGATLGLIGGRDTFEDYGFDSIYFELPEIERVYCNSKRFLFSFNNGKVDLELNFKHIRESDSDDKLFKTIASLIKNISVSLNKISEEYQAVYKDIEDFVDNEEYEKALLLIDKYIKHDDKDFVLCYYKTIILFEEKEFLAAQKQIELSFNLFNDRINSLENMEEWDDETYSLYAELKWMNSKVNFELKKYDKALWDINDAYFLTRDTSDKADYKESREEILNSFMGDISNLEFHKRRIIYIEKDLPSFKPETILPLRIDSLECFVFPPSHPLKGELYVGHPLQPNYYYPLDEYEQLLFESQFVELNHLLQCLGASEIRSERIKGSLEFNESEMKSSNKSNAHFNQKGEGGNKLQSGNVERNLERKSSEEDEQYYKNRSEKGKRMVSLQRLTPQKAPYIPMGLVWYNHNETWQKLAEQRLLGGLNYYEMIISSNSVRVINEREKSKINNDYKHLITAGYKNPVVNAKGSKESEKKTESEKDIMSALNKEDTNEWRLIVTFAPIEDLAEETISLDTDIHNTPVLEVAEYNENELKYIDDIKFAIEDDGIIDEDERRMLERNQTRYNISDEKAKELEDEVLNQNEYTAKELEFIEELNFILDHDGDIDDGDRRILLRLASRLDITEQRAKELEEGVLMSREASTEFTEQEQEYIKELNFCLEEGPEISRSARRLLDRVVESLGLSEERAREIEEIVQDKLCDSEND